MRFFFVKCLTIILLITFTVACTKQDSSIPPSTLRIGSETDPLTMDPRQTRNLPTSTFLHMLYEGLTRINQDGVPVLAIAESVDISEDQKTYTFKLKKTLWSDGSPVTAFDFEKTWKSILDPQFASPNAYQLYVIKGAKLAKQGKGSLDDVGIKAPNKSTLVVELEYPTPHFLNLTATCFYYPVSSEMREKGLNHEKFSSNNLISNGPFKLEEWSRNNQFIAVKNPCYWDAKSVKLGNITVMILDNNTALSMYERDELDWIGSPLSILPTDALATLKKQKRVQMTPSAGIYLYRFNIEKPPLNHVKIRQALSYALNRQDLVEHTLQGNQIPAMGLIPPWFFIHSPFFRDNNITKAQQLLKEALAEQNLSLEDLPPITISYSLTETTHKIAQVAQQQWKENLGLNIQLQGYESKVYYDHLKSRDYQVGIGSWFADVRDPISFLDVFKYKNNGTNNTQWENTRYIQLLNLSSQMTNRSEREKLLKEAELVLFEEMPIAPIFYNAYNYLKQPHAKGIYFSELGYLDLKDAYIENYAH